MGANILQGSLPEEYSTWKECEFFAAGENFITGTLPLQYSKNKKMDVFLVENNLLTGILPVQYSTMKNMKFEGSGNKFTGKIPKQWSSFDVAI
eukprot:TRINITY_DN1134_c1_g1_i8.p2 TRINITY_DN1134_c1_g1~~TRINITY_DN1134_c1_g1_i8.p2  ORF type:complete len:103 (+),score=14.07 TRINITY_DN1134_c1_g1_i8:32-310(+)